MTLDEHTARNRGKQRRPDLLILAQKMAERRIEMELHRELRARPKLKPVEDLDFDEPLRIKPREGSA